jgi:hypothetical protein
MLASMECVMHVVWDYSKERVCMHSIQLIVLSLYSSFHSSNWETLFVLCLFGTDLKVNQRIIQEQSLQSSNITRKMRYT